MLTGSAAWKVESNQRERMWAQVSGLWLGELGWQTEAGGTARMRAPERVVFRVVQSEGLGQQASLGVWIEV